VGTVFKKTATKPMPAGAETFVRKGQQLARWTDAKGRSRIAPVTLGKDGQLRIVVTARTYTAKYRDGQGIVREVATGCRDETAAKRVLADLLRRRELVKANMLTVAEDSVADMQGVPIGDHFTAFLDHLEARGTTKFYRSELRRYWNRLCAECGFRRLHDLSESALSRWLAAQSQAGMSARLRNAYHEAAVLFGNWCVNTKPPRLLVNPFAGVPKADAGADPRHQRRALTEAELQRLLDVARRRPLHDALLIRRGKDKGKAVAKLKPETIRRLELLGRERALIYKTLILTGLRKGELSSLTVGQVHLDGRYPFIELHTADEKNRKGSQIPLRADLAADLASWIADRQSDVVSIADGPTEPFRLSKTENDKRTVTANTPLFSVPIGLVRVLNGDLKVAGIPKRDERGRFVDVHALRDTFGSLLSKGGVAPRTAQAAMRHSTIDLTMNVYTDPKLLDVAGALDALPALPLDDGPTLQGQSMRATGTDAGFTNVAQFAPAFAPNPGNSGKLESIPVKSTTHDAEPGRRTDDDVKSLRRKRKGHVQGGWNVAGPSTCGIRTSCKILGENRLSTLQAAQNPAHSAQKSAPSRRPTPPSTGSLRRSAA
jgi:integrase